MCFWIFKKKPPPEPEEWDKLLLTFAINDYPGEANDLNGCLNDQKLIASVLTDFKVRKFSDDQVTRKRFIAELERAASEAKEGSVTVIHYSGHGTQVRDKDGDEEDGYDEALYLYDGVLIDDKINEALNKFPNGSTEIILLDSCFSGSATRDLNKRRFVQTEKRLYRRRMHRIRPRKEISWIVYSGCGENETSMDAYIDGDYYGAFTFYAMHTMRRAYTYNEWYKQIRKYLPSKKFPQTPTLEGPEAMLNNKIFT